MIICGKNNLKVGVYTDFVFGGGLNAPSGPEFFLGRRNSPPMGQAFLVYDVST
jgi:hypothetical protein